MITLDLTPHGLAREELILLSEEKNREDAEQAEEVEPEDDSRVVYDGHE